MGKFEDWFKNKLKVRRYPLPAEIYNWKKEKNLKYVINVSDEYIATNHKVCIENNIHYFWFPMNECTSDIGLNSIFGALQILWIAEKENARVLLHCHAGANRSPTVAESYYFMRTKKHLVCDIEYNKSIIAKMFVDSDGNNYPPEYWENKVFKNNRLQNNIYSGNLPSEEKMETFLKECEKQFLTQNRENEFKTSGNLDNIKLNTRI